MYDIEFFGFLRKPERIHVDKLKSSYRVAMHLGKTGFNRQTLYTITDNYILYVFIFLKLKLSSAEKTFIGEDENITRAVHKAAKHLYPTFIDCKQIGESY